MSVMSVDGFDVVHVVRIRGALPEPQLLELASQPLVDELVVNDLLRHTARGYTLTVNGLREHTARLAEERAATDQGVVAAAYDRFLAVNAPVKAACAAWQASGAGAEDLAAAVYELDGYLRRVAVAFRRAGALLPRYLDYQQRLTHALDEARGGHSGYVTDMSLPSFHTVWFECHEDFLLTLGISREDEERHG